MLAELNAWSHADQDLRPPVTADTGGMEQYRPHRVEIPMYTGEVQAEEFGQPDDTRQILIPWAQAEAEEAYGGQQGVVPWAAEGKKTVGEAVARQDSEVRRLKAAKAGLRERAGGVRATTSRLAGKRKAALGGGRAVKERARVRHGNHRAVAPAHENRRAVTSAHEDHQVMAPAYEDRQVVAPADEGVQAASAPAGPGPVWTLNSTPWTSRGDIAADWALTQLDKPYVWAGTGPRGYDCSGLTMRAWARVGVKMDHWTGTQWTSGRHVRLSQIRRGDLLFFGRSTRNPADISHVGIYIGRGLMVHAPQTGDVVRVAPIWRKDLVGATRPA
ncbi:C40 family peptidase [Streptosporangium sp. NPDC000396]|uniref:C40 family peptidase n=1 Tax=Streptosporangium sp. NPDC000396 TaxID=3366185 RepID=UPI00368D2E60